MKRLLFLLFFLPIFAIGQNRVPPSTKSVGDYDQTIRARDTLFTDYHFVYRDTVIPVLDISYHEFSSDSINWHKPWVTGDIYIRISNDVKNTWKVLNILSLSDPLWARDSIGGIYNFANDYDVHVMNDLNVEDSINTNNFYFLDGDSLKITWLNATDGSTGDILQNINGVAYWMPITSVFDSAGFYDAQNNNIGGVGVWDVTSENVFYFRGIDGSDCITAILDDATNRIVIAFDPTCLSVTAGIGLSGGGTFDASGNVIVNLSIPELSTSASYDSLDWFAMYDVSSGSHRKVHISAITGGTPSTDSVFWIAANDGSIDTVFNNSVLFFEEGDTTINIEVSGDSVIFSVNGCPVPPGGLAGQVLVKLSDADCDLAWVNFCDLVQICDTQNVVAEMCDFAAPYIESIVPTTGYLNVGALVSANETIGDYVIDWFLNGVVEFTSATADAGIKNYVLQPFNIPVPGGLYTPVIRWVEINGMRYTPYADQPGTYSSDLLDCLDDIYAAPFTCANGNITGNYTHNVNYNYALASIYETRNRSITMDLNTTTDYIPWSFAPSSLADTISIYFVHGTTETLIESWLVGTSQGYWDLSNYVVYSSEFSKITDLRPFTIVTGDKIKFDINTHHTTTDWSLSWICKDVLLDALNAPIDPCTPLSNEWQTIDTTQTLTMTWDSINCRYNLPIDAVSAQVTNDITKYTHDMYNRASGNMTAAYWSKTVNMYMNFNTSYGWSYKSSYATGCKVYNDSITYYRSGDTLGFEARDAGDYIYLRNMFTAVGANASITDYSADPTDIRHYKHGDIYGSVYGTCPTDPSGLIATFPTAYLEYSPTMVTYDDVNMKITILLDSVTNGMPQIDCDNGYEMIQSWDEVRTNTYIGTGLDFSYTFQIASLEYRLGTWTTGGSVAQTQVTGSNKIVPRYAAWGGIGMHENVLDLCDDPDYFLDKPVGYVWHRYYQSYYRVTITDYDLADPTVANGNFQIESYLNADGTYTATPRKIFERKTGYPDVWYPTTWYP